MARLLVIEGLALEVNTREGKTNGVPNGKVYNNLVVFEFGSPYPAVILLSLKPEQVADAAGMCGKKQRFNADMSEYDGRVNYYYQGVAK
jgi:hypothetical protein